MTRTRARSGPRALLGALCVALCAGPAFSLQERDVAEGLAFLELHAERDAWYVGEEVRLTLRFGFERAFLRERLVQLFQRPLDVPVQVVAPSLEPARSGAGGARARIAFGDELALATRAGEREIAGERFELFELSLELVAERAGELALAAPLLRFAWASRFEENVFEGRVPLDRHDASVHGPRLVLRVLPLPEEGRPPEFTGAVGRFSVRAEAAPRELEVGGSLSLVLTFEGAGNFGAFDSPRLERLAGFQLRGRIEDRGPTHHVVTYDLAPRNERISELPPIAFAFFDPEPPAVYRSVSTRAIPIDVRPAAAGAASDRLERPAPEPPLAAEPRGGTIALVVGAACALVVLVLGVVLRRRGRASTEPAEETAAAQSFRASLLDEGADPGRLLAEYLAARLSCSVAAVIAPDLARRLAEAGASAELAERTARLLDALVGARYGGAAIERAVERSRAAVDELEHALRRRGE